MPHIVLATAPTKSFTVEIEDGPRFYVVRIRGGVSTRQRERQRTALALGLAAEFETIAAREGHLYNVDPSRVRDGVVTVEVAPEDTPLSPNDHDILLEVTTDACGALGLYPSPD